MSRVSLRSSGMGPRFAREISDSMFDLHWRQRIATWREQSVMLPYVEIQKTVVARPSETDPSQCWSEDLFSEVAL